MKKVIAFIAFAGLSAVLGLNLIGPSERDRLPCLFEANGLRSKSFIYCALGRHYVASEVADALEDVAEEYVSRTGRDVLLTLDASSRSGNSLWPHHSHGTGQQIDLQLPFEDLEGKQVNSPRWMGYGAYEPPRASERQPCGDAQRPTDFGNPRTDKKWRVDETDLRILVDIIISRPDVRRIFLAPHLSDRIGRSSHPKVRFAGCHAARHDDHIHIDFQP